MENIGERLTNQKDVLGRLYEYIIVPMMKHYPRYVIEHPEIYGKYIHVP